MTEDIKRIIDSDLDAIINHYNNEMELMFAESEGGKIRGAKGRLVETLADMMVKLAWTKVLSQPVERLNPKPQKDKKAIKIKEVTQYKQRFKDAQFIETIETKKSTIKYDFGADLHVYVDGQLVLAIECKSYTESAMLKRIIYDRKLLHEVSEKACYLLIQLESALGGDFHLCSNSSFGSNQYHVLMSREDTNIEIITLLEKKRDSNKPIHKPNNKKDLKKEHLIFAIDTIAKTLQDYI